MSYTPVNWEDSPSTSTPINADNLNIMDKGIADVDKRTTEIETELPKKIKNENNVIGTNHITNGSITQEKIAEDLLKLILSGGGTGSEITYEQVKTLIESKEDITNKITAFDSLLTDKDKYPTAIAVINYLKEYYYDYEEIDEMLVDLGGGGSGGTTDYNDLFNKPKINGVELNGDIKPSDLGIKNGEDYVLTDTDKTEIANIVINEYDSSIMAILGGDNGVTE